MVTNLKRLTFLLISLLIFILSACTGSLDQLPGTDRGQTPDTVTASPQPTQQSAIPTSRPVEPFNLVGTYWRLVSFEEGGKEISLPAEADLTLQFDTKSQAGGSAGCNSYGGQYEIQDGSISFSQVISTMMACTDPGVMDREQRYLQALQTTGNFELKDEGLTIQYDNNSSALHFISSENSPTATPVAGQLCSTVNVASVPEWNMCRSQQNGFEIQFPKDGKLIDQTGTTARIDLPYEPGTNLVEKYLEIDVRQDIIPCTSPLTGGFEPGNIPMESIQVNGLEFYKESREGVATGNIYTWVAYSTSREDLCVSLSFVLHSFDPELVLTPPPRYDQAVESEIISQIVGSFQWLSNGAPPPTASQPTPVPQRIDFSAGATSTSIMGRLPASGTSLYVLRALQGQTMTVDLAFTQGRAILTVWGEDGTVLMSNHTEASHFEGVLPATQDYYLLLKGSPDGPTDYSLMVIIPPA